MNTRLIAAGSTTILAAIAIFALTGAPAMFAQTETGQITGTVFDQTGAMIPAAAVTLTDQGTNAKRTTNATNGTYVFPNLLSGRYEISATAPNFQTVRQMVEVTVGTRMRLDLHLPVGSQTQIVEVTEQLARVNVETQTMSEKISGSEILNLPTITRNPYDLVKTAANVTDGDPTGPTRGVGVSINGLRGSDVSILLDGVPNSNNFDTKVAVRTPLDSVGEFTVLTNSFGAEFGRAVAGVVNVDTRRGGNAIHGTAYEFNRVSRLTSNSYDNNANSISKPIFARNQFGFSAGGALIKDKLFFFGNPEWIRVRSQQIQTATVATPQLIAASDAATRNFFSTYGKLKPTLTPLQTFARGDVCTVGACTGIAAGTPIYQKVAYGVPADSGGGDPQNTSLFAGRVDYNLSDKTQVYFRYARYYSDLFAGTVTNSPYVGYDTGEANAKNSYAVSVTHIFSPTLVSQTKLSYNRIGIVQPLGTAPAGPVLFTTIQATNSLGNASVVYPGYSPFTPGNAVPFGGPQNYFQLNQDMTKVFGNHNLRFGGQFMYLQDNRVFGAFLNAVQGLATNLGDSVSALVSGQVRDFQGAIYPQGKFPCVAGVQTPACTLTLPVGPPSFSRSNAYHEAGLYVQDSWKIMPRLTINLGLRWEYFGPQASRNPNLDSNFFFGPGSNLQTQTGTGKVLVSTDPANPLGGLWNKKYNLFAPRVGFAWDIFGDGKTSFRGGYGIGYTPNFGNVTFNVIQNPPNYGVVALTAGADVPTIPITTNNSGPLAGSSGTKALGRVTLRAVDPYIKTAYAHLWSASLERQFTNEFFGAISYTGSKGQNLYTINRLNIPGSKIIYAGTGGTFDRINDQYSYINFRTNGGFSNYNALSARAEMRNFRRQGITLRTSYTWSHALDNLSNTFSETNIGSGNLGLLDPLNPRLDKGSADFDTRHRFTLAGVWEIPYAGRNAISKAALGGWTVIPNFSARTGVPFSLWDCSNAGFILCPRAMYNQPFQANYTQTPTANPNQFNYLNVGTPNSSYAHPIVGVSDFGPFPSSMTGRNVFSGPGFWNVDFAVHKNFTITERYKLQFRAEAYNVFNHSNLYLVGTNTDISATRFATAVRGVRADNNAYSSVSTDNRNLQLALKLIF